MNFKKIIMEETDDFDWIRDTRPDILNKYFYFEPMIKSHEFDRVLGILSDYNQFFDLNIIWRGGDSLDEFFPDNTILFHHILIDDEGLMVYGGMDEADYEYNIDSGISIDDLSQDYSSNQDSAEYFISGNFNSPESVTRLDGRVFFNI